MKIPKSSENIYMSQRRPGGITDSLKLRRGLMGENTQIIHINSSQIYKRVGGTF